MAVTMNDWRDLATREGDGLEITLLWSESADRLKVVVSDERSDQRYDVDVAPGDALRAFYHPFAYDASIEVEHDAVQ